MHLTCVILWWGQIFQQINTADNNWGCILINGQENTKSCSTDGAKCCSAQSSIVWNIWNGHFCVSLSLRSIIRAAAQVGLRAAISEHHHRPPAISCEFVAPKNPSEAGHYSSSLTLWLSPPGSFSPCVKAVHDTVRWRLLFGSEFCDSVRESCPGSGGVTGTSTSLHHTRQLGTRSCCLLLSYFYYRGSHLRWIQNTNMLCKLEIHSCIT